MIPPPPPEEVPGQHLPNIFPARGYDFRGLPQIPNAISEPIAPDALLPDAHAVRARSLLPRTSPMQHKRRSGKWLVYSDLINYALHKIFP